MKDSLLNKFFALVARALSASDSAVVALREENTMLKTKDALQVKEIATLKEKCSQLAAGNLAQSEQLQTQIDELESRLASVPTLGENTADTLENIDDNPDQFKDVVTTGVIDIVDTDTENVLVEADVPGLNTETPTDPEAVQIVLETMEESIVAEISQSPSEGVAEA